MVNPIRHVDANVLAKYSLERFGYEIAIVRMQNGQPFRESRNAFRWIETENRKGFRRPIVKYSVRPERPTSHMSEPFSFSQIKFASLQFLRRIFLLGNIQCVADQPHNFAILKHRFAGAVHCPLPVFRVVNSILNVALHALRKHFPEQRMDAITIDRMQDAKPFPQRRNSVSGIETENRKGFRRPIVKYSVRPERP